jgi:uncharacterized protein (TIGR02246 family)
VRRVTSSLDDLRAIEQLKARYCRTLDTKDWEGFRQVFSDDFVSDTSSSGGKVIAGADEFVAFVRGALSNAVTVHQVQQPEIELTSSTTATGIWAMLDIVRFKAGLTMHGFGHYHEEYHKDADGRWRITSSRLTRLREEIRLPFLTVFVSDRIRRGMQRAAARSMKS